MMALISNDSTAEGVAADADLTTSEKAIARHSLVCILQAAFLAAVIVEAWGPFCDAAASKEPMDDIKGAVSVPVGYLIKEDSASVKLELSVKLSGSPFPFEGGMSRRPDYELADEVWRQFVAKGSEPLGTTAEDFEVNELLAVGTGRYSVKCIVTVRLV